jgi:hypothetical protein
MFSHSISTLEWEREQAQGGGGGDEGMEALDPLPLDLTVVAIRSAVWLQTTNITLRHANTPGTKCEILLPSIPSPAVNFSTPVTATDTKNIISRLPDKETAHRLPPTPDLAPPPRRREFTLRSKYTVPPELELNVKKLYNGTCVITRNNTSWRRNGGTSMISGPAIETCHIVPKSMFKMVSVRSRSRIGECGK